MKKVLASIFIIFCICLMNNNIFAVTSNNNFELGDFPYEDFGIDKNTYKYLFIELTTSGNTYNKNSLGKYYLSNDEFYISHRNNYDNTTFSFKSKFYYGNISLSGSFESPTLKSDSVYGGATNNLGKHNSDWFDVIEYYSNFDVKSSVDGDIVFTIPVKKDENISDNSSRLKITYEYNTEYTECTISATLIDGAFTDKIFYSNYQPGVTGKLLSKKPFPVSGITVSENQSLFFQAEDKDGNIIANNGLSVNMIGKLSSENFEVSFNKTRGYLYFTPILKNSGYVYNDIYCKIEINDTSSIRVIKDGEYSLDSHTDEFVDYKLIDSGVTWNIINMSFSDQKIKLYFIIKNRNSNAIMITKDYECTINLFKDSSVDGGIINSGTKDEVSMSPGNDNNFNNPFASLNEKSSIDDLISVSKGTFTLFQSAFSILPGWIWALISIFLTVCIVLRILGR